MPTERSHSDEELFDRINAGDEAAFEALYDRKQSGIYRYALRMCGSETVAEDVTQDVFIALIKDAARFDPAKGTVGGYLFGMARHRVLRHLQRDKAAAVLETSFDDVNDGAVNVPDAADPLEELARSRTIESVRQAVLTLPVHYREVVVLCGLQEMNYAEAAEVLGCAIGTVRSRLHRAREILVERLGAKQSVGAHDTSAVRGT